MKYWLMKSEPNVWSIDQQKKAGTKGATWDGVRNYQAAKNLKGMKKGDLCFFYHSNIGKEIVSIVEVIKEDFEAIFPPINLCGDNAAMIAMVGLEKFKLNQFNDLDHPAKPRWPLDEDAAFLKGAGVRL